MLYQRMCKAKYIFANPDAFCFLQSSLVIGQGQRTTDIEIKNLRWPFSTKPHVVRSLRCSCCSLSRHVTIFLCFDYDWASIILPVEGRTNGGALLVFARGFLESFIVWRGFNFLSWAAKVVTH